MTEQEDRKPHPDFIFRADARDVLGAPVWINTRYWTDLARLPGRQVDLFLETALQSYGWRTPEFTPPPYEGPNLDRTEQLRTLDGTVHSLRDGHTFEEMEAMRKIQEAQITPAVLPAALDWLENRFPRFYIDLIFDLAARHGTKIVFVYLPRYGGPAAPPPYEKLYAKRAGLINPWATVQDFRLWFDDTHVNAAGSRLLTDAVADALWRDGYVN